MSEVRDTALELSLVVGADKEDLLAGILGRPVMLLLLRFEALQSVGIVGKDSDIVRRRLGGISKGPVPTSGAVVGLLADFVERVSEWFLLLHVGVLKDDRLWGITTTGMTSSTGF